MSTVSIKQAQATLADLIHSLSPGEEVVITENNQPVARLIPATLPRERKLGSLRGTVTTSADFDEPLDDFADYTN
ncbi:MAG: type II toxin-antitoxin system Phd/YefM family antitoxin [Planctomycetaceae bacterium]|nr:type II toxin-antitoxin system Phd/YefM family antitoxin [Planctomycetaceae bacterium]